MDHAKVRAISACGISLEVSGVANGGTKRRYSDTLLYCS
jgi:hypothetical protein